RSLGDLARRDLTKLEIAKERHQHRAAAFHSAGQRMTYNLHRLGPGEIGNATSQCGGIERPPREEIEINRLPMPQPQRQRRSAVEREMIGRGVKLRPEHPLRRRQYVEAWLERRHEGFRVVHCYTVKYKAPAGL